MHEMRQVRTTSWLDKDEVKEVRKKKRNQDSPEQEGKKSGMKHTKTNESRTEEESKTRYAKSKQSRRAERIHEEYKW